MAQETFIVFVNLIAYQSLLMIHLLLYCIAELIHYLLEYGLVEHIFLAVHHAQNVVAGEQLATLKNDAVAMSVQSVHPQLLVEYLAGEDEHLHVLVFRLQLLADFDADGCAAAQSEVEQHEVGLA